VPTADGVDLLPSSHPQGRGLGCPAAGSGTKTGTSHMTGRTDRPDRTCMPSRFRSGTAPGKGKKSPKGRESNGEKGI